MAINGQTVLGVIPARGGSKRVYMKNLRLFRGKSLIQRSVESGRESKYIDRLLLSTEDKEIAWRASLLKVEVLDRPKELATDDAMNEDVLRHAMKLFPHDWVVLLQPTSPLRTSQDIDACIERAQLGEACVSYRRDGSKNGAVYVAKREWIEKHDFSNLATMRYVMDDEVSVDCDYEEDFRERTD